MRCPRLRLNIGALLGLCVMLAAWSPVAESAAADPSSRPAGVDWFNGDVTQALQFAQRQHRPVFVYFGAVWCPPCQELKATFFRRRDVLDRLALYVPVYLDGDAGDAQRWADRLHVTGYPTVLILRADGSEVQRIAGGMDLSRYAEVLNAGLTADRSVEQILAAVEHGRDPLSLADCRILAYNGWQLDDAWILSEQHPQALRHLADVLEDSARHCPRDARLERARLQLTSASAAADAVAAIKPRASAGPGGAALEPTMTDAELGRLVRGAEADLGDTSLMLGAGDVVLGLPDTFFAAAARLDPMHAAQLLAQVVRLTNALAADPRYSAATQLYAVGEQIVATKALTIDHHVPDTVRERARRRVDRSLAQIHEPHERASVFDAAESVLEPLGDTDRLYALLSAEVKTSATPYYYMADLGDIEEHRGHPVQAIEWFRRGYQLAQGPATRIQWGSLYVRALIRLRPQDEVAIATATKQWLGEFRTADGVNGRNRRSLERVAHDLHAWGMDGRRKAALADLRKAFAGACRGMSASNPSSTACGSTAAGI